MFYADSNTLSDDVNDQIGSNIMLFAADGKKYSHTGYSLEIYVYDCQNESAFTGGKLQPYQTSYDFLSLCNFLEKTKFRVIFVEPYFERLLSDLFINRPCYHDPLS